MMILGTYLCVHILYLKCEDAILVNLCTGLGFRLLFFLKILLNPPIILEIIPTKIDLLTKIHANLLINTKRIIYNYK